MHLLKGGHRVTLLGHTEGKAESLAAEHSQSGSGKVEAAREGAISGEVVFLALPYSAAVAVVRQYRDQLHGKILVDITNPMNFQTMEPTSPDNISGAEGLVKLLPESTLLVTAFNTVFSRTLPEEQIDGFKLDVFEAGDNAEAITKVSELIEISGLHSIDAGLLKRARQLEALGLLHVALQSQINGGYNTAIKIII